MIPTLNKSSFAEKMLLEHGFLFALSEAGTLLVNVLLANKFV